MQQERFNRSVPCVQARKAFDSSLIKAFFTKNHEIKIAEIWSEVTKDVGTVNDDLEKAVIKKKPEVILKLAKCFPRYLHDPLSIQHVRLDLGGCLGAFSVLS